MNKDQLLEKYILGEISEAELSTLKKMAETDEDLQAEIELENNLVQFGAKEGEEKFTNLFSSLKEESETSGRRAALEKKYLIKNPKWYFSLWRFAPVFILIIGLVVWGFFNQKQAIPTKSEEPINQKAVPQKEGDISNSSINTVKDTSTISTSTSKKQAPKTTKDKTKINQQKKTTTPPIASNNPEDFVPNLHLETNFRGDDIRIQYPDTSINFPLEDQYAQIKIHGFIALDSDDTTFVFKLQIFSNKQQDFETENTVYEEVVSLDLKDNKHLFSIDKKIKMKPGRYYCLIFEEEEPIFGSTSFFVGKQ